MTAEEFVHRYENKRAELVRGVVREVPMADLLHSYICATIAISIDTIADANDLGRVMTNDSFIKVRREPDSVFWADVCFISYQRLPKGPIPPGLLDVVPELVVDVRSPSDSWSQLIAKVLDYLAAGVKAVVAVNPTRQAIAVYRSDIDEQQFTSEQELTIPDVLPGFRMPVARLFS